MDRLKGQKRSKWFYLHHQSTSRLFALIDATSDDGMHRYPLQRSHPWDMECQQSTWWKRRWSYTPSWVVESWRIHHFVKWSFAHLPRVISTMSMKPDNCYRPVPLTSTAFFNAVFEGFLTMTWMRHGAAMSVPCGDVGIKSTLLSSCHFMLDARPVGLHFSGSRAHPIALMAQKH